MFAVGLASGFRPGELYSLTLDSVYETVVRSVRCISFRSTVSGIEGESKTERGDFAAISRKPLEFLLADEVLMGVTVNFYAIIKESLTLGAASL